MDCIATLKSTETLKRATSSGPSLLYNELLYISCCSYTVQFPPLLPPSLMKFKKLNQVNGGASLAIGASLLEITRGVHVLGITAHAQCQKHHEVTCWLVKDLIHR